MTNEEKKTLALQYKSEIKQRLEDAQALFNRFDERLEAHRQNVNKLKTELSQLMTTEAIS